jgi:predicted alpha/beta hydrolase family esterase
MDTRLLIVPGLHDSGPAHWQSWLHAQHHDAVRVVQRDWTRPDVQAWAETIGRHVEAAGGDDWIAVAHSFGCLALLRHLSREPRSPIRSILLVAPAEPDKFNLGPELPQQRCVADATLVGSRNDPWMAYASSRRWASRWGCRHIDLGYAGHVNVDSGYGPLPLAHGWVARRLGNVDVRPSNRRKVSVGPSVRTSPAAAR